MTIRQWLIVAAVLGFGVTCVVAQKLYDKPLPPGYGFFLRGDDVPCEPIAAEVYDPEKGWHAARCSEIMSVLSAQRDVRQVIMMGAPSISNALTYSQYESTFRISRQDFEGAQANCRKLLSEGYAHPDILAQCRATVRGVVPYGLKLQGEK